MPDNTKVNLNTFFFYRPPPMQMDRRFYLISGDKKFSNQFQFSFD